MVVLVVLGVVLVVLGVVLVVLEVVLVVLGVVLVVLAVVLVISTTRTSDNYRKIDITGAPLRPFKTILPPKSSSRCDLASGMVFGGV